MNFFNYSTNSFTNQAVKPKITDAKKRILNIIDKLLMLWYNSFIAYSTKNNRKNGGNNNGQYESNEPYSSRFLWSS